MRWQLSEEQQAYQEAFGGWLASVAGPQAVRSWLEAGDGDTFAARFVEAGWGGVGVPEDQQGQGGGFLELVLTAEALGGTAAPSAAWLAGVLAAPAVGHSDAAVAVLVPADAMPLVATGLHSDISGRISGTVEGVLAGAQASRFVVVVDASERRQLRLVDAGAPGVEVRPAALLDRSRAVASVTLAGVESSVLEVPVEEFVTGFAARAAVLTAADSLGAMQRMLDLAVEYSKQREQFGVPIGSFQAVKHAAASILVDVEAARSALYYTAASVDTKQPGHELHAAAVKAQVTAAGAHAADSALTLFGAIGYTWEHDLHYFYKRVKLNLALYGTPSQWNELIADSLDLLPA